MVDLVIWSGGYDSTLILDRLCSSREKNVWAFSLVWDMVHELKVEQEEIARNHYIKYAKKKGYEFCHNTIKVESNMGAPSEGLPQALAWLCFALPYLPQESRLYFGYHRGDDFWRFHHQAEQMIIQACILGDRSTELQYPLELESKWEIVKECRKRGIPDSCMWTCEHPVKKGKKIIPCGKCEPCITLKLAGYEKGLRR